MDGWSTYVSSGVMMSPVNLSSYCLLADYESYVQCQQMVSEVYKVIQAIYVVCTK